MTLSVSMPVGTSARIGRGRAMARPMRAPISIGSAASNACRPRPVAKAAMPYTESNRGIPRLAPPMPRRASS
jgi:hypothetical protein